MRMGAESTEGRVRDVLSARRLQLLEPRSETPAFELGAAVLGLGVSERLSGLRAATVELLVPLPRLLDRLGGSSRRRLRGLELPFEGARLLGPLSVAGGGLGRNGRRAPAALEHSEAALAEGRRRT